MHPLYQAADPLEAEILKDYLAAHGIAVTIFGGHAWGARGELAANAYPQLHLCEARDEPQARELLHTYERNAHNPWQWRCDCGEMSPDSFDLCWSCGLHRLPASK